MIYARYLLYFLCYGVVLTLAVGLLASWIDRKVTARVQYRVGPPLLQPAYDVLKLMGKETLIPTGASLSAFLGAPLLGLAGVAVLSAMLCMNNFHRGESFLGDFIVALYLLALPSLSVILGGFASASPLASLGASREMKLLMAYELPFVLAALVPVILAGNSLRLDDILAAQTQHGVFALRPSGFIALLVALLCVQAKLGFVPFDAAEAETEISGGALIEYSGAPLGLYRLMKQMALFAFPLFLILMFMGGIRLDGLHLLWGVLKYVGLLALITVIRNTNPRVRIDQAMRFFWGRATLVALVAVLLALAGY